MNILHLIEVYRYAGLFVLLAIEYFILIVPGETELTTAGVLSKNPVYHFNIIFLIVATGLGTFTGSMIAYFIGRVLGRPFILKYGKFVLLTESRLEQSERLFRKYTILTLFISRYIAFVRDIVPYVAGMNRVKLKVVVPVLLVSSFLWTSTFILFGGLIVRAWHFTRTHGQTDFLFVLLAFFVLVAIYIYVHRRLRKFVSGSSDAHSNSVSTNEPKPPM